MAQFNELGGVFSLLTTLNIKDLEIDEQGLRLVDRFSYERRQR